MTQPKIDKATLEQVRDLLIVALARAGAEADPPIARKATRRIRFEIKAADCGGRRLPTQVLSRDGDSLQTGFLREEGALVLDLEALGAPSIQRLRQKAARLVSTDGRVDFSFSFDKRAGARLRLSAAPEIADSLAYGFEVVVEIGESS